jgi:hypothetical protein
MLAVAAPIAHAQKCELGDAIIKCWQRFNPDVAGKIATAKKVATANTGIPGITQPNASSVRDFLNLFTAAVETATVSEGNNALTLDWNIPFDYLGRNGEKIKLQAIFTKPALSAQTKTALGSNSTAITELTDSLDDADDIKATLSYSPHTRRLGRSLAPHDALLQGLLLAASPDETEALQKFAQLMQSLQGKRTDSGGAPNQDTTFEDLPDDFGPGFMADIESLARTERAIAGRMQGTVDAFATVLNNQPQAYGTVIYHSRDEIAGQNELSAKFTFELGRQNLNKFLSDHADNCELDKIAAEARGAPIDESDQCLADLLSYANKVNTDAGGASRLAISVEYQQAQHTTITLPSKYSIAALDAPGSHSLVYSLTWGLPMETPLEAREGRLEVALNYENVSTDPNKKDRFIGSVTYTQKLSDTITVPISLVYANHTQFLPQSDRQLGVHFGLSYKLPDLTP